MKAQTGRVPSSPVNESTLEDELKEIMSILGVNDDLTVVWTPDATRTVVGEVKGRIVHIYEPTFEAAVKTLRHEVVDYMVSRAIAPYRDVTNAMIKLINDGAYHEKEKLVERLCKLLG